MRSILKLDDPPRRLAAAFALGIFIAFSPWLGLHIVSCIVLAWLFRLNKVVVLTASFINNPWTIVPMYGFCLWFGMKIVGAHAVIPHIAWNELSLGNAYQILKPYLWPFVAGTLAAGLIAAAVFFGVIYWAVIRYRRADASPRGPSRLPAGDGE